MSEPNLTNIRLWAEALESGEFKQGRECLASNGRYCCLGVACEVAIANGVPLTVVTRGNGKVVYDESAWLLPLSVREWLGIGGSNPMLGEHTASLWNDSGHADFPKIAAMIREEYGLEENANA